MSGQPEQVTGPDSVSSPGEKHGPTFWILLVAGWIAIAIGLFGVFDHPRQASAFNVLRLLVGSTSSTTPLRSPPVTGGVGRPTVGTSVVPCPCQVWLIVAGTVTLYAYPLVGDYGQARGEPSQLPFNYAHNFLIVLGCITALCGLLA